MPGQPKTRALVAEMERRANDEDCTPPEYAERWIESGGTLLSLAADLADELDLPVMRATLSRYLHRDDEERTGRADAFEQRLTRARSLSAFGMVEKALEIADKVEENTVHTSRLKVQSLQWTAERFNREQLGQKQGVSVTVTVGSLHLEALRQPPDRLTAIVTGTIHDSGNPPRITGGEDTVDAEVVE
jgi:hypothetical protein